MGIYIKGMEMPKNCNECKFGTWSNLHQTACCKRHDFDPCFKDYSREYMEKRADFCPLVEIPEPHGRLIDGDALGITEHDGIFEICHKIKYAPTVIEGSEE